MSFLLGTFLNSFQRNAFTLLIRFRDILYKLVVLLLTSTVIVWLSIFLYGTFYYTYMPAVSHVKPVHLQFRWCDNSTICSFPSANVTLVKRGQEQLLMRGQQYKVYLDLEMPESPVNQHLGMFMVKIDFLSRIGEIVHSSSRSAMLRYKSNLHQTLSTMFFLPTLLTGTMEEKQLLSVELCDIYEEEPARPATYVVVQIQSKSIEVYSSQLRIYAHFTGLRYLMFHWPMLSAVIGIGTNLFFLSIVALMSWYRYLIAQETHEVVVRVGMDTSKTKSIEERRTQVKEFLLREQQRQSKMRASFSSFDVTEKLQSPLSEESISRTQSLEALQLAQLSAEASEKASFPGLFLGAKRSTTRPPFVTRADLSSPARTVGQAFRGLGRSDENLFGSSDNNSSDPDSEGDIITVANIPSVTTAIVEGAQPITGTETSPTLRKRHFLEELPK